MNKRLLAGAAALALLGGCAGPLDIPSGDIVTPSLDAVLARIEANHPIRSNQRADEMADASIDAYQRLAERNSPELESAYQRYRAAASRVPQVTALPDPMLSYAMFLSEVETRVGAQQQRISVSQRFPWFGKLDAKGDAATAAARAELARYESARLDLRSRVVAQYATLYELGRAIDLTDQMRSLLEQIERIARVRYTVATGSHPQLMRVQIELSKLEDRVRTLRERAGAERARFNALLNRPTGAAVTLPTELPAAQLGATENQLRDWLDESNPRLIALAYEVERRRHDAEVAHKAYYPDVTVALTYTLTNDAMDPSIPESGDDPLMLGFSVNVPIWREKYDAGVAEALARRSAAVAQRAGARNMLMADLSRGLFEYDDAQRQITLYERDLIPKADQALASSMTGFQAGTVSYLDLIDAERVLLELQLSLERARAKRVTKLAQLEAIVGRTPPLHITSSPATTTPTTEANP